MDRLERQVPCEGFVRRIASSFSNKINCNDKNKPSFQKYPLSRNGSFSFSGVRLQKGLSPSVADIKKVLENPHGTDKSHSDEKKSNRSKSLVNRIASSLRSKPTNDQVSHFCYKSEEFLHDIRI